MSKDTTVEDQRRELAFHDSVEIAVKDRNTQIAEGADPDPNVGTGFYPATDPQEVKHAARLAQLAEARKAKADKKAAK